MAFVVTSGQLQAVHRASEYPAYSGAAAITLSPTLTMTYGQLWKAQPALRAVTSFLARNVASLPIDPYTRLSATDREKAADHPLARLLEQPLPGSKWTKYRLFNRLMHDLTVFDSAYWLKMRSGDQPALQPIPPSRITPRGGSVFAPEQYRIVGNSGHTDVDVDQVVHFHGYNPDDERVGCAPVETLRQILAEEHAASVYREQMWRNGARVAGYIKRPREAPRWSDGARERFKTEWQAQYAGDGPATGGTPVLEDGMEFSPSSVTPRDAQYVEARKLTREEVAVAYHVSPVMMGVIDGTTISSVNELHKMLYQDTLPPWLTQIAQDIECQLLPDLDPVGHLSGTVFVEFNLKAKLAGSFEEQASALQSAVGGPWMVRNEARAMNNLPAVEGGDELIVPLNVVEGGLASPNDTAPDNPDNGPSNGKPPKAALALTLRQYFLRQGRVVASKLGAGTPDPAKLLGPRWDAELAADAPALDARSINEETRAGLAAALQSPDPKAAVAALFASYVNTRAEQIARDWEPS